MITLINKYKKVISLLTFLLVFISPITSFAHDAYFLQVLIDEYKYQYVGSVVEDEASFANNESKHYEAQLGGFEGLREYELPYREKKDDYKNLLSDTMIFTFPSKEIDGWFGSNKNNATKEDVDKAYFVQETLMVGLNDALRIVNDGKEFESLKDMMETGNELAEAINNKGSVNGYKVTTGRKSGDKPMEGTEDSDYITITSSDDSAEYEFVYRVKKGYKGLDSEYSYDTEYITWHQLMYQANYSYQKHGYTTGSASELVKPHPVEEAIVSVFESTFNQLRNLLGLYDINELIFNEGIRGSQAWTHGIMSKDWSDKAIAYHWLFQAIAWSLIIFAIVKNLIQRNFATINPVLKISLMESVQNLLITGFILANAIPVLNMFMFLNVKLVAVFGATAPDYSSLSGMNNYSNFLGGILIQFFYLGVSIYLNFVYIMRAITLAILIATAPMFIVSIAFGGKWKQLFNTWMRELIGNIYLQSFHAFMLSFFFAISTSARGIEGMIVTMALIPMTEFFRSLVMGQGGGIAHSMGMKSMAQGASLVGSSMSSNKKNNNSNSTNKNESSKREKDTTSTGDTGNTNGNSDKIRKNAENMNQRQRMESTKETLNNREIPAHIAENPNHPDAKLYDAKSGNFQTKPEGRIASAINKAQGIQEKISNSKEALANNSMVKTGGKAIETGVSAGKVAVGAGKIAVGVGTAMALGAENPNLAKSAMNGSKGGVNDIKSGVGGMTSGASETLQSKIPENTKAYANTLPNGDMQVHRHAGKLHEETGIAGASMEGNGKDAVAKYTYDVSKMKDGDKANIEQAYQAFARNDTNEMAHYKKQGIEKATKLGNQYVVRYNQAGMSQMGIKSVQTIGEKGNNPRVVETKNSYDPINTRASINIPKYEPPKENSGKQGKGKQNKA